MSVESFNQWYEKNSSLYESLAQAVVQILRSILSSEGISYIDIPYRLKSKKSCFEKYEKKDSYNSFNDMTDIAGLRVITLVESDLDKVSKIIHENFSVHLADSGNKADLLGADKFGYRSIHFICDIGEKRENLSEFTSFKGLCFEIQVRTALSHAWAEIEHDRGYKLSGELPAHLKRRFNLLSGLLESADLEFNRLTDDIENYKLELKSSKFSDLLSLDVNKLSLINYLNIKFEERELKPENYSIDNFENEDALIYKLLKHFNIEEINEVEEVWSRHVAKVTEDWSDFKKLSDPLVRVFVLYDLSLFLKVYSDVGIHNISRRGYEVIQRYYAKDEIDELMERLNLNVSKC